MSLILKNGFLVKCLNNSVKRHLMRSDVTSGATRYGIAFPLMCATRGYSPSWGPPKEVIERKDIEFRVFQTLCKHEKIDKTSLSLDSHLTQDLGLDSLDVVECVVHLEDEFKVEIPDTEAERLLTPRLLVEYLFGHFEQMVDQNQRPDIEFKEGMTEGRPIN